MAGTYTADHAGALADVADAGAPVSFAFTSPGTEQTDGTFSSGTTTTVNGQATEEGGDAEEYRRLSLAPSAAPRLFFVPTTEGDTPAVGASCTWGGTAYIARSVKAYRPAGLTLFAYVIIARGAA